MKIDELIARLDLVAEYLDQRGMHGKAGVCRKAAETICILNAVPAADVRPVVRGRWDNVSRISRKGFEWFKCSNCGMEWSNLTNFCPNCGADMREVDDAH